MKRKVRNKKGQYAIPLILIGFMLLFTLYLLLVYPSERAEILGSKVFNETKKLGDSPLGGESELIFSSAEIFEVGRTTGQKVFEFRLGDFSLEYPSVPRNMYSADDLKLSSTVFTGGTKSIDINGLDLESTKDLVVNMNISKIEGNPKIVVLLNETKMYEGDAKTGETTIRIQKSLLSEDNPMTIKVSHQGLSFWQIQSVEFNSISIDHFYYDPINAINSDSIIISQNNYKGNELIFEFNVTESITDGDLVAKIQKPGGNKEIVWTGNPESGKTITFGTDISAIGVGTNVMEFEAEEGGVYKLSNGFIRFLAETSPPAMKTYSFDIDRADLFSGRSFVLGVRIDRVIEPGQLFFNVGTSTVSYYFPSEDLAVDAWSYTKIDKSKLKPLGNKITVDSVNGRFKVDGFVIIVD